ncbi:Rho GTPase activation protein [Halteromyces radiatus]|uniref:Rho GTPase activation protein n=1 Tax=Halteromyces radiatus TaxID=101107 RepID=UPI0022209F7D|nr:Rho GTPase activation protein [Halteromyces radiatus]KAI8093738.1 Rho GTPase activation protein [Halteromyces radiatus]
MSYDVRPPLFGSPIVTAIARSSYLTETGLVIPGIVARCFQEINKDLKVEGLFRRSGSASVLNQLQCQFEQSDDPFQVEPSIPVTVHYWTGLLKRYLQLLPEPLIPQCKQPLFLEALDSEKFRVAMESMPLEHHHLLKYLLQSIRVVTDYSSANHMSASAMAIIVAPTFVHIDAISQLMQQSTPALEPIPLSSWRKATQRLLSVTVRKRSSNKQLVSSMSTHSVPFPLYQPQHILQLDLVKQSSQWANTIEYLILNVHFFIARKPKKKTLKTVTTPKKETVFNSIADRMFSFFFFYAVDPNITFSSETIG